MRAGRLPLGLLAPISLVILVVALGALQYRWVGQVGEAEREQLRESLNRRAGEFADDFDREVSRAFQTFRPAAGTRPDEPERFARQFDEWQAASRFPDMVKNAYYASAKQGPPDLYRFDPATRAFVASEWPEALASIRTRLSAVTRAFDTASGTMGAPGGMIAFATLSVLPDVPAILIPEEQNDARELPVRTQDNAFKVPGTGEFTVALRSSRNHAIVELDREYISRTMLPALAERHFPQDDAARLKLSIVDGANRRLATRGLAEDVVLTAGAADASASFFGVRIESIRSVVAAQTPAKPSSATSEWVAARGSGTVVLAKPPVDPSQRFSMVIEQHAATVDATTMHVPAGAGWTLRLQHGAGSVDAAVALARTRNLWLSFGILGVLAASAGLVMINARRSEKLAAQQMDFVATVSHELRTPLAVIRSAAQNLSAGVVSGPAQARQYGELIENEGRRLTDMVEQVLEYAGVAGNRQPASIRPVDAGRLVRDVIDTAQSLPESAGIEFDVRVDDTLPPVMADEDAVRRALLNLVGNAVKYAAAGRWIGVTAARGTAQDEGYTLLSVTDRGHGIPQAELAHVFEPFYRGRYAIDRQIHGNGLGLSLVKRIAEAHGGRVAVRSAPDQGSTFTLYLPVATGAAAARPAADDPTTGEPAFDDAAGQVRGHSA